MRGHGRPLDCAGGVSLGTEPDSPAAAGTKPGARGDWHTGRLRSQARRSRDLGIVGIPDGWIDDQEQVRRVLSNRSLYPLGEVEHRTPAQLSVRKVGHSDR